MTVRRILLAASVGCLVLVSAAPAQGATLRAGVGRADITPQTGYYLGGWTRADRTAKGQHTRLFARSLVLERDGKKVALVSIDLFMVPGGMVRHIGEILARRGFSERNILISASHTHSGPGGYANFPTLNTAAPSRSTITDPISFYKLLQPDPADRQLYTFITSQIASAIAQADDDRGPARAGWGSARILGLTRNRSLEAHLNNHGIQKAYGAGRETDDPGGYDHTIDPTVNVLRVDKVVRRRVCRRVKRRRGRGRRGSRRRVCRRRRVREPLGGWSTFANHGTVTKSSFQYYNADHHGSALQLFERGVRREGKVRSGQLVVNVYGNSNEGDMSAGLDNNGPAGSDYVGRVEARAMLGAWRAARRQLSSTPALDLRWTRTCFCGQVTAQGKSNADSQLGLPFLTGSEEERGPLFDVTGVHYEDSRNPAGAISPHGNKIAVAPSGLPRAVPLLAIRVGRRLIVSLPGEGTKEVGDRIRAAVGNAVAGSGIEGVVLSGLANEFVLYFTTPEEYDRQHYEGGNTHFGRLSSVLMHEELAKLAGRLVRGEAAQSAFAFDPTNGVAPDGPPYGPGAASALALAQPVGPYPRLTRVPFAWRGGLRGLDRPVGRAFVIVERRRKGRWRRVTSDLGLEILWSVDGEGRYLARWEVPLTARAGLYRIVVSGKRYRIVSRSFRVTASRRLRIRRARAGAGRVAISLAYPRAVFDRDLTHRPTLAYGGVVRFRVGSRTVRVRRKRSRVFSVRAPAGAAVTIAAGQARDRYGNRNRSAIRLR